MCKSVIAESPRWLISKNKTSDAYDILQKIAKANKRDLDEDSWHLFIKENESHKQSEVKENFIDLIKSPRLVIITLLMFINWYTFRSFLKILQFRQNLF